MVLPKLSITSSLYIQLNLFFLYSFQTYHLLLIFLLSYAISCMLVGIFCALLIAEKEQTFGFVFWSFGERKIKGSCIAGL